MYMKILLKITIKMKKTLTYPKKLMMLEKNNFK